MEEYPMRYIITRHGANGANQSTRRLVLGSVEVDGDSTAARTTALRARLDRAASDTIDATTTFRRDDGTYWHACHNQHFRWLAWNRANAADKDACLRQEAAQIDPWAVA
jgi:hypothetical protein